jgi:uncharacterized LabA/DUF88 family protein
MNTEQNLAVLIDADNIPSAYVKEMMEEIAKYGKPTIKRIYGDWTRPQVTKWKNILLENALSPIQQYGYTTGKNATDSAMIIDAMDILYSDKVDGFCIASSDSDFTKLAMRLREAGMNVIGIGEKKTPEPFVVACDRFIYLEILKGNENERETKSGTKKKKGVKAIDSISKKLIKTLQTTIDDLADEEGWAYLGDVGNLLQKKQPDFDARNYGFQKLTKLIDSTGKFEIEKRENQKGRFKLMYVRNK